MGRESQKITSMEWDEMESFIVEIENQYLNERIYMPCSFSKSPGNPQSK
jgi:hypothetical protein